MRSPGETWKGLRVGRLEDGGGYGRDLEQNVTELDAWVNDQWAQDPALTTGLTYAYRGGVYDDGAAWQRAVDGTVALTDNTINYVERILTTGVVSSNTTGFTHGRSPMAKVTTASGRITDHEDWRPIP